MKIKKSAFKILIWAVLGFCLGFIGAFMGDIAKSLGNQMGVSELLDYLVRHILVIQLLVGGTLCILGFYYFRSVKKVILLEDTGEDGESEQLSLKIDFMQDKALTIGAANYIVSFALFGIAVDDRNLWILGSTVVFLSIMATCFSLEISLVNQVKQRDPMKKGDPVQNDFAEQWIASCDEAEKLMIFKTAYKSFQLMKYVLIIAMVVMFFSKMILNTGNTPIIMIAILWLVQTISYAYYGTKIQKGNFNI